MTIFELFMSQMTDPFRIGIVAALVLTMLRTRGVTGVWLPLAAGVAFIAVLIPTTLQTGQGEVIRAVLVGLVSNIMLLVIVLGLRTLVLRVMGR